jgi:hypothetical protein
MVGLTSTEGLLDSSRDERCRLIGLRFKSSCSASEPESDDVPDSSPSASLDWFDVEDCLGLALPDLRVYDQRRHFTDQELTFCLRLAAVVSPTKGDGDLNVATSFTTANQLYSLDLGETGLKEGVRGAACMVALWTGSVRATLYKGTTTRHLQYHQ